MKKFVNVRIPVIMAITLCLGCATGFLLYYNGISAVWITAALIPVTIIFSLIAIFNRNILFALTVSLLMAVLFIGGACNCYFALFRFDDSEVEENITYRVQGKVIEKGFTANGEYVIIDGVTIDNRDIKGKVYVYLGPSYGEFCDVGYTVDFDSTLEPEEPFPYGELNFRAEDNVKYFASAFGGLESTYHFSFFGSMRSRVLGILTDNIDEETAAITYAMLTGNTQRVDEATLDGFRFGGVAHIFAVSGLHIGILYGICTFLTARLRLNRYFSTILTVCLITLYSAFCGFTLSSVRAVIMCSVSALAMLVLKRYDGLNGLAVAVLIILSINPLSLFSVGFQLSVCAVGGISVFSHLIAAGFRKIKVPDKVSLAIGTSFGAQFGTMPVMLARFGYLSAIGLLLNLIVIPLITPIFIITFLSTTVCSIIPPIAPYVLPYSVLPLELLMSVFVGGGFERALISGFGAGLFVPIYFIGILAISDKLNLKFLKRLAILGCTVVILTSYVLMRIYSPFNGYNVIVSAYTKGGEILIKSPQGAVLIVSDDVYSPRLDDMLNRNYSGDIDALIILGNDGVSLYNSLDLKCKDIFVCEDELHIQPYKDIEIHYAYKFSVCGINCRYVEKSSLIAEVGGVNYGIYTGEATAIQKCDILIGDTQNASTECGLEVFFNNRLGPLNAFDCGDMIFKINDGKYTLTNTVPPRQ